MKTAAQETAAQIALRNCSKVSKLLPKEGKVSTHTHTHTHTHC